MCIRNVGWWSRYRSFTRKKHPSVTFQLHEQSDRSVIQIQTSAINFMFQNSKISSTLKKIVTNVIVLHPLSFVLHCFELLNDVKVNSQLFCSCKDN
jgi:hypothetical protein